MRLLTLTHPQLTFHSPTTCPCLPRLPKCDLIATAATYSPLRPHTPTCNHLSITAPTNQHLQPNRHTCHHLVQLSTTYPQRSSLSPRLQTLTTTSNHLPYMSSLNPAKHLPSPATTRQHLSSQAPTWNHKPAQKNKIPPQKPQNPHIRLPHQPLSNTCHLTPRPVISRLH